MRRTVLISGLLTLVSAGPAEAGVSLSVPAVVTTSDRVTARGNAPRAQRVLLQQRVGGRWALRARARGGRYAIAWRAPDRPGVVTLRVAALRNGRRLAVSRARRVAVGAVEVLAPSRVVDAPPPGTAGTLRYSGRAPVSVGEHVALDVGAATPHGLLVRVVARRVAAGQTVLETVPASLIDAIPEGRIAAGAARPARARGAAVPERFRSALGCGGGATGAVDGSLAVTLDPRFEVEWSRGQVRSVRAATTFTGDATLVANLSGRASCSLPETPVARWDAPPLRFSVGPIPVVIVPRTDLFVSATAEASAAVEAGIAGPISATAGLRYAGGDVEPAGSFTQSLAPIEPATQVDASIGARVTPSVTFLLYGQAGPRFDLAMGLRFDAHSGADPWWTLTAPVELSAGLRVPRFSRLEVAQRPVFSRSFPIAQAESGADTPAAVRRAAAEWDGRTDVDLHVWDAAGNHAWFGDKAAIPGALLSVDDTDGFGPESFDVTAAPDRGFTYGLCYFDDRGLGSASVTVRITDRGAGTRESVHLLRRSGDSAIVAANSGFTPPAGWCRPR